MIDLTNQRMLLDLSFIPFGKIDVVRDLCFSFMCKIYNYLRIQSFKMYSPKINSKNFIQCSF